MAEDDEDEEAVVFAVGVTTVAAPTADLRTEAAAEATGDWGAAAEEDEDEVEEAGAGVADLAGATTAMALELVVAVAVAVALLTVLGTGAAAGATAAFGGGAVAAVDEDEEEDDDLGLVAPGSTLDAVCQIAKPAADTAARTSAPAMMALDEDDGALSDL